MWNLTSISFNAYGMDFPKFADFLWYLMYIRKFGDELMELVIMVAWCLWFSRNRVRQERARLHESTIVQKAR